MAVSNIEIKVKGYLRTPLSAEAATTTIDVDFFREDDPSTVVELEADTLMFEFDPLNKTGKGNEIILATSNTFDSPVANRTRLATVTRGLPLEGHEQTGSATRAKSYDAGTEVAIATGVMAKMVNKLINEVGTALPLDGGVLQLVMYADSTARDAAIATAVNGMVCGLVDTGVLYQYIGGAWTTFASGTTVNGSTTVAGKFEEATVAEQGTSTATGGTGARLVPANANLVKTSTATYTSAYLTGGTSATAVAATWAAVSDGTFTISIDGTEYDITAVDFTGNTTMALVAATIQAKVRTATSALETVTWSTDHFIVSSVDTSSSSAITVTTAEGTGTDISGVGGTTFMDCETVVGTVTDSISLDENKIGTLDAAGAYAQGFLANSGLTGEIKMWSTATAPTNWLLCDGSEVSRTTYATLFAVIADKFGGGDGSTTFALPNFKNRAPIGMDTTVKTVIDSCETNWTAGANVISATDAVDYKTGSKSIKLTVAAGAGAGEILGYYTISVANLYGKTRIGFWLKSSVALSAGDLQYMADDTAAIASPLETINIPAIQADVWTKVYLTLANPSTDLNLISHGIYQVNDKGAFILHIDDFAYGENYEIGATGGEKTETQHENEIAAHTHTINWTDGGGAGITFTKQATEVDGTYETSSIGGSIAQNNMQPYITVNYIIKT